MQQPGMLLKLKYSEPFYNWIQTHIQNLATFMKIGKPSVTVEIKNPGNPQIFKTLIYYKPYTYSENPVKQLTWRGLQK